MWVSVVLLLLFAFGRSLGKTTSREYCNLFCIDAKGNRHTNSGCDIAGCAPTTYLCSESIGNMMEFRKAMLRLHNHMRNKWARGGGNLQPITDMHVLNWDEDLEYLAKCWANTCAFMFNYCRQTPKFKNTGMNIAFTLRDTVFLELRNRRFIYWEHAFNSNWNTLSPENITAQREDDYELDEDFLSKHSMTVQVVWAKTTHIGCARSEFKDPYTPLAYRIVCVYGPQGNRVGKPIFRRGPSPCSACPHGEKCGKRHPNLCGEEEDIVLSQSHRNSINFTLAFALLCCRNVLQY